MKKAQLLSLKIPKNLSEISQKIRIISQKIHEKIPKYGVATETGIKIQAREGLWVAEYLMHAKTGNCRPLIGQLFAIT